MGIGRKEGRKEGRGGEEVGATRRDGFESHSREEGKEVHLALYRAQKNGMQNIAKQDPGKA